MYRITCWMIPQPRGVIEMSLGYVTRLIARGLPSVFLFLISGPVFASTGIVWGDGWELRLNGQKLSVKSFTSVYAPDEVAQQLVRADRGYERYLVAEGRILLSALTAGQHRLAQVQARGSGSHGYVSTLFFGSAESAGPPARGTLERFRLAKPAPAAGRHNLFRHVFEFPSSASLELVAGEGMLGGQHKTSSTRWSTVFTPSDLNSEVGAWVHMPE